MIKIFVLLLILILWVAFSFYFKIRRKKYFIEFQDNISKEIMPLFNENFDLIQKIDDSLNKINTQSYSLMKEDWPNIAIAATNIYTKRRRITYFNTKSRTFTYSYQEPIEIAKGVDISPEELIKYLEIKRGIISSIETLDDKKINYNTKLFKDITNIDFSYIE